MAFCMPSACSLSSQQKQGMRACGAVKVCTLHNRMQHTFLWLLPFKLTCMLTVDVSGCGGGGEGGDCVYQTLPEGFGWVCGWEGGAPEISPPRPIQ